MLAMSRSRKNLFISFVMVFALLGFGVVGCTEGQRRTGTNAAWGTGIGAALGAGIGALTGNAGLGAGIGAGAGLLGGLAYSALTDDQGNQLTEAEMREARVQALEMEGRYDPDIYALRITRDANGNILVVPQPKPQRKKSLEFIN